MCDITDLQLEHIALALTFRAKPHYQALWVKRGSRRGKLRAHKFALIWSKCIATSETDCQLAQEVLNGFASSTPHPVAPANPATPGVTPPSLLTQAKTVTPGAGPGTELKKLLGKIGIVATPNCSCNARAAVMDTNGPDWCEANHETILAWLADEAAKRHLPFVRPAASIMLKLAIHRSRKAVG